MLSRIFKPETLRISRPFGSTFLLSLIIFPLLLGFTEIFSRTLLVDPIFPPPSVNSTVPELDVKLDYLNQLIKRDGAVKCILLGSSQVDGGIDPAALSKAYSDKMGKSITCYNFGLATLTGETVGVMAQVLVKKYHPR